MSFVELSDVLGNLGEFIGSIAVLVTLIYLAVQVNHSKRLLERNEKIALSQVYYERVTCRMEMYKAWLDPQMATVYARTIQGETPIGEENFANFDALNSAEQYQIRGQQHLFLSAIDNTLYQASLGLIEDEEASLGENIIPIWFKFWEHIRLF